MLAWNDWYHCTAHTYGTWLRGDSRGWRARHHREHVDGNYKCPPAPGTYDKLYKYSKSLMKRDPIRINDRPATEFILHALVARLQEFNVPLTIASFDGTHAHFLLQCPNHDPRIKIAIAKQFATAQFKKAHRSAVGILLREGEGLWGKRSYCKPITSEAHYMRTIDYIQSHVTNGATVIRNDSMDSFDPQSLLIDQEIH